MPQAESRTRYQACEHCGRSRALGVVWSDVTGALWFCCRSYRCVIALDALTGDSHARFVWLDERDEVADWLEAIRKSLGLLEWSVYG